MANRTSHFLSLLRNSLVALTAAVSLAAPSRAQEVLVMQVQFDPKAIQHILDTISQDDAGRDLVAKGEAHLGGREALIKMATTPCPNMGIIGMAAATVPGKYHIVRVNLVRSKEELLQGLPPDPSMFDVKALGPGITFEGTLDEDHVDYVTKLVTGVDHNDMICLSEGLGTQDAEVSFFHELVHFASGFAPPAEPAGRRWATDFSISTEEAYQHYAKQMVAVGPNSEVDAYAAEMGYELRHGMESSVPLALRSLFDSHNYFIQTPENRATLGEAILNGNFLDAPKQEHKPDFYRRIRAQGYDRSLFPSYFFDAIDTTLVEDLQLMADLSEAVEARKVDAAEAKSLLNHALEMDEDKETEEVIKFRQMSDKLSASLARLTDDVTELRTRIKATLLRRIEFAKWTVDSGIAKQVPPLQIPSELANNPRIKELLHI